MEISEEVYENFQKVAEFSPVVERVAESLDNGILDRRIEVAVAAGFWKIKKDRTGYCQACF